MDREELVRKLVELLGSGGVSKEPQDLYTYSCDMYPRNQILKQGRRLPPTEPVAVCFPTTIEQLQGLIRLARSERLPLIPYAAGSGVTGATIPEHGGIMVDMKRFNAIRDLRPDEGTVVVESGMMGERLEDVLNSRGLTLGHFPSSFRCSTVGGWVACRSAGQFSSRYGKIEDLTIGMEVVLPTGEVARMGILGGGHPKDPMLQLVLGSEGTVGFITQVALKVEPLPDKTVYGGLAFLDLEDGVTCMRRIMQAGIRPTVLRLYDPLDTIIAGTHSKTATGEDIHKLASTFHGWKQKLASVVTELNGTAMAAVLYQPQLLNRIAEILPARPLLIYGVQGDAAQVARNLDTIRAITEDLKGEDLGEEPGQKWFKRRYAISYKQAKIFRAGSFVDTMEVATSWDNVLPLYKALLKTMGKYVFIMAHFSHAYPHGCSIYFTFAGYRPTTSASLNHYRKAWHSGMTEVLRSGGTLTHHHGVGILKRGFLHQECPAGRELFRALKGTVDPDGVMNPGKLYGVD